MSSSSSSFASSCSTSVSVHEDERGLGQIRLQSKSNTYTLKEVRTCTIAFTDLLFAFYVDIKSTIHTLRINVYGV